MQTQRDVTARDDKFERGTDFTTNFVPKVRIENVVNDDIVDAVVETIISTAKTGIIGDGKLFILPVSRAIRIRTSEENEAALTVEEPAMLSDPCKK